MDSERGESVPPQDSVSKDVPVETVLLDDSAERATRNGREVMYRDGPPHPFPDSFDPNTDPPLFVANLIKLQLDSSY